MSDEGNILPPGQVGTIQDMIISGGVNIYRAELPRSIDFMEALPRDPNGNLYKRKTRRASLGWSAPGDLKREGPCHVWLLSGRTGWPA